jgi:hypothetical protein
MKMNLSHFIVVIFCLLIAIKGQSQKFPKIKAIKGYLYYNQNDEGNKVGGTLSENIIDNKEFYLWNTIIGEGSAIGPSTNLLVIVEIQIAPTESSDNGRVKLTVFDSKDKVIFSQEQDYSIFEKGNIYSTPFLLNDTGCGLIKLKAELIKSKKVTSFLEKTIDFECGE